MSEVNKADTLQNLGSLKKTINQFIDSKNKKKDSTFLSEAKKESN